jgi:hypothetical protein
MAPHGDYLPSPFTDFWLTASYNERRATDALMKFSSELNIAAKN